MIARMSPYDPSAFPPFAVTVDLVVLTVRRHALCALVVRRGEPPFQGRWALPGGFVRDDEDLSTAAAGARRGDRAVRLGPLGPGARQRRPSRTARHLRGPPARPPDAGGQRGASRPGPRPARAARGRRRAQCALGARRGPARQEGGFGRDGEPPAPLAFDHARILADGVERARSKIEYSSLATAFCPAEFTVGELRRVYEAVWGVALDPRNFHRKVTGTPGFLVPAGGTTTRQGGRPAQLFRAGGATLLNPPMLRPEV